jgi:hypothetical protein
MKMPSLGQSTNIRNKPESRRTRVQRQWLRLESLQPYICKGKRLVCDAKADSPAPKREMKAAVHTVLGGGALSGPGKKEKDKYKRSSRRLTRKRKWKRRVFRHRKGRARHSPAWSLACASPWAGRCHRRRSQKEMPRRCSRCCPGSPCRPLRSRTVVWRS